MNIVDMPGFFESMLSGFMKGATVGGLIMGLLAVLGLALCLTGAIGYTILAIADIVERRTAAREGVAGDDQADAADAAGAARRVVRGH